MSLSTKICNFYEEVVQGQHNVMCHSAYERIQNFAFLVNSRKNSHLIGINIQYDTLNDLCSVFFPTYRCGHLEVVKYLIEVQGCSTGCTDGDGKTPLHLACR